MNINSSKSKKLFWVIAVLVLIFSVIIGRKIKIDFTIKKELTEIAESHGLKDVKVIVGNKMSGYDFYSVTVDSSNLSTLTYSQMYSLANAMYTDDGYVSKYTSNGGTYNIYTTTKSIYKNNIQIHDDYYNSQSYKEAVKNKEDKSDYSSKKDNSSQTSSSTYNNYYKSEKTDDYDRYNAKDYSNEEDFYYDHYDDFFDYYDAEDYYKEHTD